MKRHHYGILIATLLLLGVLAGYSLFKNGFLPVAWVNGDLIFLREIEENTAVSQRLYELSPDIASQNTELASIFLEQDTEALFERALESSIINAIFRTSATQESRDRAELLTQDVFSGIDASQFQTRLQREYGWDLATFNERIIGPQVLRRVLAEEYGDTYGEWSATVQNSATVRVWFVPFEWNGSELISNE